MKSFLPYLIGMLILLICCGNVSSQTHMIDSLEDRLKSTNDETVQVLLLSALARKYYSYDTIKSFDYLEKGYQLAKKVKWNYALGDYYQNKADILQSSGRYSLSTLLLDSAIVYYNKAINDNKTKEEVANAALSIATSKSQKADVLSKLGRNEEAIREYISALEAWKKSDRPEKLESIAAYYSKISTVYYDLNQFSKALEYDKLSLGYRLQDNKEQEIAWGLIYVCDDFYALHQIDSALFYLAKAKPIVEKLNNHNLNIQYYGKLAQGKRSHDDFKGAIQDYQRIIQEAQSVNNKFQEFVSWKMIGFCYLKLKDFENARRYLLMALAPAGNGNYLKEKMEILQHLVDVEDGANNRSQAFVFLKELSRLKDSVSKESTQKAIAEIENKYQSSQKQNEIIRLQKNREAQEFSLKQKTTFNYILLGSLTAVLLLGYIGYRNIRHRQLLAKQQDELHRQHISELEKDKQLVAVDSMLQGQEEERSRLAKDLHDGLGGLLSGVKFSLSNMKDNLMITPDNMAVFERSLDLIDTSIKELRRVAQNMMPEMLAKFGLDEALKEYCNTINATKLLEIKYQSIGMETRIEKSSEIIIYRIIQELLNNMMKHAVATEAIVQLIKEENRFNIIVEDNGKGFDMSLLKNNKGAGLTNIQSRVDYLKGRLDIHSDPGKGTLINIEFNI